MLQQQMLGFLVYFFSNPSILGIGLAIVFGAIWLACYRPPLFVKPWLWGVLFGSAAITILCVAFAQIPLHAWTGKVIRDSFSPQTIAQWVLLLAIPQILVITLIQEGAKLVPVVIYWWRQGRNISLKMGLLTGAAAGAGFGIFEAQWVHNVIIASGWGWEKVEIFGFPALAGFWERFFVIGLHTGVSALAGWGLARGWGWQFYLLAILLHAFAEYNLVLVGNELVSGTQAEFIIAAWTLVITGGALWLRERRENLS